ncbi:hypothetical protein [Stutzerimonas nitrititolerans]
MQQARRERALPCLATFGAATRIALKRQQTLVTTETGAETFSNLLLI